MHRRPNLTVNISSEIMQTKKKIKNIKKWSEIFKILTGRVAMEQNCQPKNIYLTKKIYEKLRWNKHFCRPKNDDRIHHQLMSTTRNVKGSSSERRKIILWIETSIK